MEVGDRKPVVWCLAALRMGSDRFIDPALVPLAMAAELHDRGYMVLVDPQAEADLAAWERLQRSIGRKWFERD